MSEDLFPVKPHIQERAHIKTMEEYQRLYRLSLDNPGMVLGRAGQDADLVPSLAFRVRRGL